MSQENKAAHTKGDKLTTLLVVGAHLLGTQLVLK
jgi:hypothetical protein